MVKIGFNQRVRRKDLLFFFKYIMTCVEKYSGDNTQPINNNVLCY